MTALKWTETGKRFYETGIDRAVFYPKNAEGVPWVGIVSINEQIIGGDVTPYYLDQRKTIDFVDNVDFQLKVTAFTCPPEFRYYDGYFEVQRGFFATQQRRKLFGFSYRTLVYNELGESHYKIHLVYDILSSRNDQTHSTVSDNNSPNLKSWTFDTIPPPATTRRPTAHLVIDISKYSLAQIQELEDLLYGTDILDPQLPSQQDVADILEV